MKNPNQSTEPELDDLKKERRLILGILNQKWANRAFENPEILTADLLRGMRKDCKALNMSDF